MRHGSATDLETRKGVSRWFCQNTHLREWHGTLTMECKKGMQKSSPLESKESPPSYRVMILFSLAFTTMGFSRGLEFKTYIFVCDTIQKSPQIRYILRDNIWDTRTYTHTLLYLQHILFHLCYSSSLRREYAEGLISNWGVRHGLWEFLPGHTQWFWEKVGI